MEVALTSGVCLFLAKVRCYAARMLRPRSVLRIGNLADQAFTFVSYGLGGQTPQFSTRPDLFAEFLFEHEFPAALRQFLWGADPQKGGIRRMVIAAWEHWVGQAFVGTESSMEARERWFTRLGEALLQRATAPRRSGPHAPILAEDVAELVNALRLDGYEWADGRLRRIEENVFDVEEQAGALEALWGRLLLTEFEQLRHNLRLADEHYEASRWGDCIAHARHVVELTLLEVAEARHRLGATAALPAKGRKAPVIVRDHLRITGFYDQDEQDLVKAVYGLVSRLGGHPNMAPQASARILRQHAFTVAHFLLLRFEQLHPPTPTVVGAS